MPIEHLDLFCGGGGATLGADAAGCNTIAGVDHGEQPLQTVNENLDVEPIKHDLSNLDVSVLPQTEYDWIHGSPPCKGFSTANDNRGLDDPRNTLVFDFIDWVEELQPTVVTMENVTGMLNISNHFMDEVESAFRNAGYKVKYRTLNAADYGVPQTRKRVITVGIREDHSVPSRWHPKPTHNEIGMNTLDGRTLDGWVTVQEAIGDLPPTGEIEGHTAQGVTSTAKRRTGSEPSHSIGAKSSNYIDKVADSGSSVYNHKAPNHDDDTMERLAEVKHGDNDHPAYHRPHPDEPSDVIIAGHMSQPIHYDTVPNHEPRESTDDEPDAWEYEEPSETLSTDALLPNKDRAPGDKSSHWEGARRLTVRECARIQSFPDWYVFTGTKTEQYAQVGNAVPPLLQYHIATHIKEYLNQ